MILHKQKFLNNRKLNHITIETIQVDDIVECYCNIHKNRFSSKWVNLIRSKGCSQCRKDSFFKNRKKTKDDIIEQFTKVHGNFYDYTKVNSYGCYDKVTITCPIHGDFIQQVNVHKLGSGCPKCKGEKLSKLFTYTDTQWIEKFNKVHNFFYVYDIPLSKNDNGKIKITCPIHGDFWQLPNVHAYGHGCQECSNDKCALGLKKPLDKVILDFKNKHKDKYNYDKVIYKGAKQKIIITCKKHGDFLQTPNDHLSGYGCPKCYVKTSKKEEELLNFIKEFHDNVKSCDRTILDGKEIDILLPDKKIGIEFNGIYWHSQNTLDCKYYHYKKYKKCHESGIELIQINENEWDYKKDIVKSTILHKIGKSMNRIHARKCVIIEITTEDYNNFCTENHLQGVRNSSIRLGCFHNGEIVSVMGFLKHMNHQFELSRFCIKKNYSIVGAASKLFCHFTNKYDVMEIVSFCDNRIHNGNMYEKLGFILDSITEPKFNYIKNGIVFHSKSFEKHRLFKKIEKYDSVKTRNENMFDNGYRIMFDCGNKKFIWRRRLL
jgi:hypothetical protein